MGGDEASALIVHSLLEAGANQFLFALLGKLAPVHEAARLSYAHCLRELYSQDAGCISFPMEVGLTALHYAVQSEQMACVEFHLEKGAEVDFKSQEGLTALHYAVQSKQMACVEFLLEKGAEVDFKCREGNTPAHYAGAIGERDIMDYLISQGADPLSRNAHGFSPFGKLFGDIISKKKGLYNTQAAHENERAQSIFPEMSLDECQKLLDEMSKQRPEKWSDKAHIFHQVSHQVSQPSESPSRVKFHFKHKQK